MDLNILFLLVLATLASGLLSYVQYFYKGNFDRTLILPAFFRFCSLFFLILLLINPKYHSKQYLTVKPTLRIALDGSKSMSLSGADDRAMELVDRFRTDDEINKRFDVEYFVFGSTIRLLDTVRFSDTQTDIELALIQLDDLASGTAPIVIVSDGIQTLGKNYSYAAIEQRVFPVIVGDTLKSTDLEITLVNANSFVSQGNTFEAEVFANFSGQGEVRSEITIESKGTVIARRPVVLSENDKSINVVFELSAAEKGRQLFKARIGAIKGEREMLNNERLFEVDVLDERTEIALIYGFPHPDLGMIRQSLEVHEKKKVDLIPIEDWNEEMRNYSVFVVYQPDSRFKDLFSFMTGQDKNYFLVTGTAYDADFMKQAVPAFQKEFSSLTEEIFPVYSEDFQRFYLEDIRFSEFPSLSFNLGQIRFNVQHEDILKQSINGIQTDQPLLTTFEENGRRRVVLFGENIWKWRLFTFQKDADFEKFDQFLGSLIQYLYISEKNQELELFYEKRNFDDQEVKIRARRYDSNLNLDLRSALELQLNGDTKAYPMFVSGGFYEVRLGNLNPGEHEFRILDRASGTSRSGRFEVLPYSAEQMNITANVTGMNYLAENTGGEAFFPSQIDDLLRLLIDDPQFTPVERVERKRVSVIDQKWLLALIVLSLSIEWIIRKYRGLV